jgi:hypothetical protein
MKKVLEQLLIDLTNLDNLIQFELYDENGNLVQEFVNVFADNFHFPRLIRDFFLELDYEIFQLSEGQKKIFGRALLTTIKQHFHYQKQFFFNVPSEEVESLFYLDFDSYTFDFNLAYEFEQRNKEAAQKATQYLKEIQQRIIDVCGTFDNTPEPEIELKVEPLTPLPKQLNWKGTPAQFGFIINELIGKGYLERPTSSFNKDAQFYLSIFDIKTTNGKTTIGNLANEINENKNSFSGANAAKFSIPNKDKLN